MGNRFIDAVEALLPTAGHDWREAGALFWLANFANEETGLAWPSCKKLIGLVQCGKNMIGPAIDRLEAADRLSIYRRAGRVSIYLVHPDGLQTAFRPPEQAVREHLKLGRFGRGDVEAILAWISDLGALSRPTSNECTLKKRRRVPAMGMVVENWATPLDLSLLGGARHPHGGEGGIPTVGNEPIENPKITQTTDSSPDKASRNSKRSQWQIWRGQPEEVCAALIADGGKIGQCLAAMTTADALVEVAQQQRAMGFGPKSRAV